MFKPKKPAAKKDETAPAAPKPRDYAAIIRPMITEKATGVSAHGQVVFEVALSATRQDVKNAIQSLFKVKVVGVNTLRRKGKTKNFRGRSARRADIKLAYVTLAEGQNIDVSAGI